MFVRHSGNRCGHRFATVDWWLPVFVSFYDFQGSVKRITPAFSCGARSAFKLKERDYLRSTPSRRQLQGFVMRNLFRPRYSLCNRLRMLNVHDNKSETVSDWMDVWNVLFFHPTLRIPGLSLFKPPH